MEGKVSLNNFLANKLRNVYLHFLRSPIHSIDPYVCPQVQQFHVPIPIADFALGKQEV